MSAVPAPRLASPLPAHAPVTLAAVLAFLRRRWPGVTLTTLAVCLAASVALHLLPLRYAAHADVLLDPQRDATAGPTGAVAAAPTLDTAAVESAIATVKGNTVLLRVVRREGLAADPDFNGAKAGTDGLLRRLGALLGRKAVLPASAEQYAVGALFKALKVERVGKADVLSVTVAAHDPALAARLANAVAAGLVHDQTEARLEAARREAAFFAERLAPLGEQLRRSEEALARFRQAHDLAATATGDPMPGRPGTLNEQQLTELTSRLAQARAGSAEAWAHYDQARGAVAGGQGMEGLPDVVRSPLIAQLRQQQAEVTRKEADLAARYSDGYPALVDARAERREIERALAREMARIVANLKGAYDIAKSQEDGLKASVALATGAAGLDSDLARQLRELERVRLVDQTVFETYLARARAAEQQATFERHDARIISPAVEPIVQAVPQTRIVLFCALLLGLGLGVGIGLARDALAAGFASAEELEAALRAPVLAVLPWLRPRDRRVDGHAVDPARALAQRPHGAHADAFGALRAGLGRGPAVVLVASAAAGEGRSLTALGLAVSAARAGRRVLLVDADLRAPALSRYFGFENRLGLVDVLSGVVGTDETTVPLGAGLAIMPAGRRSAVAPDLFGSRRMAVYLDHLRGIYDLVLVDAAPMAAGVDAAVLARAVDRILFVVGWRDTARDIAGRGLARLGQPGKLAGLVFNQVGRPTVWRPPVRPAGEAVA